MGSRVLSHKVKWPRHEVDDSPPSGAWVKKQWSYISTAPNVFKVRRWTTLLFFHVINVHSRNAGVDRECHTFIFSAMDGYMHTASCPGLTTHSERHMCPMNMRLSGLYEVWWWWRTVCAICLYCIFKSGHLISTQSFSCMCYPLIKLFTY
jgi:hypothetical protein